MDLAPCPFCEKPAGFIVRHIDDACDIVDYFDIGCNTPGCYLEYGADWHLGSKEEASGMWNTRGGVVLIQPERKTVMDEKEGADWFFDEVFMQDIIDHWAETYAPGVKVGRWYYDCQKSFVLLQLTTDPEMAEE